MTEEAVCRRARILAANVALRAGCVNVRSGQRKSGCIVVVVGVFPCGCTVAHFAGLRNSNIGVIRICCAIVVREMAVFALRRQAIVDAARMALQTSERNMRSG